MDNEQTYKPEANMTRLLSLLLLSALLFCSGQPVFSAEEKPMKDGLYAKIATDKGDILIRLFYNKTPLTVINFAGLAEGTLQLGPFITVSPFTGSLPTS